MSDPFAGLPRGHFGAILADPPWHFSTWSARGRDRCPDAPVTNTHGYDVRGRNNSPLRHYAPAADYDPQKDFAGSLEVGYAAIRARVAAGGPGWGEE